MAKLIVTRPRLGRGMDAKQSLDVVIDGEPAASIGLGETIEFELAPGPHQVSARFSQDCRSQPVGVELAPEGTHRLALGPNLGFFKVFCLALTLAHLPLIGGLAWFLFDVASLPRPGIGGGTVGNHSDWSSMLVIPALAVWLTSVLVCFGLLRDHCLILVEIPTQDMTDEQVAELLRARPFRWRISIRQVMIAVAVLAIACWASLQWSRSVRADSFRSRARHHADLEALFRGFDRRRAARADYHAAMRRKYEKAAASGVFSVDPDPPMPP